MTDLTEAYTAAMIRLQVAVAALQEVSGPIVATRADLLGMVRRDPENANLAETAARLDGLSALVTAALQIAWGARTDIPMPLQRGLPVYLDVAEKLLAPPRQRIEPHF
jgi:hypothetical protein